MVSDAFRMHCLATLTIAMQHSLCACRASVAKAKVIVVLACAVVHPCVDKQEG